MDTDRGMPDGMTLVWDVDDVLNALTRQWFTQEWLPVHPQGSVVSYARLTENPPHRILGVPKAEYLASLDAYRARCYGQLVPDAAILAWMQRHGHRFRHIALTAVPLNAAAYSGDWIYRHWGQWIRTIQIVPSPRMNDHAPVWDRSKTDFLSWLGHRDVMLVEDNPTTCAAAVAAGFRALLVPQPWNRGWTTGAPLSALIDGRPG